MISGIRIKRGLSLRHRKKELKIRGFSRELTAWLNANKGGEGYKLAVRILRRLQELGANGGDVDNKLLNLVRESGVVPFPEFLSRSAKWGFAYSSNSPASEPVSRVLHLTELGAVDLIVHCYTCKKWFLATRNDAQTHPLPALCRLKKKRAKDKAEREQGKIEVREEKRQRAIELENHGRAVKRRIS